MKKRNVVPKRPPLKGGGGVQLLDRLLVPRIEQYALNNNYRDVDEVSEYLRRTYKEYQRRQQGTFRTMVTRAIEALQRKGGVAKPELQLQTLEAQHLASRSARTPGGTADIGVSSSSGSSRGGSEPSNGSSSDDERGGSSSSGGASGGAQGGGSEGAARGSGSRLDSDSDSGSGGSSSDPELDPGQAQQLAATAAPGPAPASHMNNSLLNLYARTATTPAAAAPTTAAELLSPPPAFAPLEVVAAAAVRALAKERLEGGKDVKGSGRKHQHQKRHLPGASDADGPSTSGRTPGGGSAAAAAGCQRTAAIILTAAGPQPAPIAANAANANAPAETPGAGGVKRQRDDGPGGGPAAAAPSHLPKSAAKRVRRLTGIGGGGGGIGGGGGGSAVAVAKPVSYADLGGIEEVLADIRELIEYPLKHPEVYAWLGVEPPRGVLLHGPPGCGKTALANAIANECGVPFLRVSAPEIVSGMSGESEAKLRQLFAEARDVAPCIVFIDEIDAIFPKRETAQREMERRIVAQMLTCMDDLSTATASAGPPTHGSNAGGPAQQHQGGAGADDDDDGSAAPPPPPPHVVVIGATNRPDALDTALRRAGRFDREIALGIPTEAARTKILQVISKRLRLEGNFDFRAVAKRTPGFVGADLAALTKEAAAVAVTRIFVQLAAADAAADAAAATVAATVAAAAAAAVPGDAAAAEAAVLAAEAAVLATSRSADAAIAGAVAAVTAGCGRAGRFGGGPLGPNELSGLAITMSDFEAALPKVQPSVRREGFTTTPDVTWDDVGALAEVREELSFAITEPIRNPEGFEALGLPAATGVLLYGPPGCGKTLVAKAVANESGANFISIKGPELLNKYVGESERAVRQLFARARAAHPCVLFFDEMDALAPRRGTDNNQAAERVVNQLLTEMDGVDSRQGIFIVAATNRPDMIDPALLRPGRLDKVLYVPLPPPQDRAAILRALIRRTPLEQDVELGAVALDYRCEGFSGADVAALVREAAVMALKESMAAGPGAPAPRVGARHFEAALNRVQPSVSRRDRKAYDALRLRLRSTRSHIQPDLYAGDNNNNPAAAPGGGAASALEAGDGIAVGGASALPAGGGGGGGSGGDDAVLEDVMAAPLGGGGGGGAAASGGCSAAVSMDEQDEVRRAAGAAGDAMLGGGRSGGGGGEDGDGDGDVMETV